MGGTGYVWLGVLLSVLSIAICFIKDRYQPARIYITCISALTVVFFVYFTDWDYIERYILMLVPFSSMLYSLFLGKAGKEIMEKLHIPSKYRAGIVGMLALLMFCGMLSSVFQNYRQVYKGDSRDNMDYMLAYGSIGEYYDLDNDVVPVVGLFLREPYWSRVISHYDAVPFDRVTDMDIFLSYVLGHKEGILTCEDIKLNGLRQGADVFILDWTDHLSGQGIDSSNVEVSHWNILEPAEYEGVGNVSDSKIALGQDLENHRLYVTLGDEMIKAAEAGAQLLCIKITYLYEGGITLERAYQILLSESPAAYTVDLSANNIDEKNIQEIVLSDGYALYQDGQFIVY